MRLLLTGIVFVASLVAAVFVHAAKAEAGWRAPQAIDAGHSPRVAYSYPDLSIAYAQGESFDPVRLLVSGGNDPYRRLRVPSAGRVAAFDVDFGGKVVALREVEQGGRPRVLALVGSRWRRLSTGTSARDAELAVASSGAAAAVWMQREQSHWVVHAALRQPAAGRFGPARRLSGLTSRDVQTLTVAVDDGGAAVATWTEKGDLMMARTVGEDFGTPVRVHDRTAVVAGAYTAFSAVRGSTAVVAFTRLEDREPPEYGLHVATQTSDTLPVAEPVVEPVAKDVGVLDVDVAVGADGTPFVLSSPIGPPNSLRVHLRDATWTEAYRIRASEAPSNVDLEIGGGSVDPGALERHCVTWTELSKGYAWVEGERLALGRAWDPDCGVRPDGQTAVVAWDRGAARSQRIAEWFMRTP